ncbi:MAG: TetR/AcrR family transcriptional regulator [Sedimentisphaerales bacterium]|nr:TetR/AcrR family transcriptional regulator [Sedimentisphaerales bacterium]
MRTRKKTGSSADSDGGCAIMAGASSARCEQIVAAAIELLSEGGMAALTTKSLARAVGVTEPALYRHFDSKQDILLAILAQFEGRIRTLFAEVPDGEGDVLAQIQAVYMRIFHSFAAQPSLASVIFAEEIFRHDERLADRVAGIMDTVEGHVLSLVRSRRGRSQVRKDIPVKDLARIIMGSLRFLVTRWRLSGYGFDLEREGAALWRSLRTMIVAPAQERTD